MKLAPIRETLATFGVTAALHDVAKKAVGKFVPLRVLRTMKLTLDRVDRRFLAMPAGYVGRFADVSELRAWSADPQYDLDEAFLRRAVSRGDRCYAIMYGGALASYGWYSKQAAAVTDELTLHFDETWVYMYKGFSLPAHRGKRLHAVGMAHALDVHIRTGSKGILSYVESNNFPSLRSCYRMGYEDIGTIVATRVLGTTYTFATSGCRAYGLHLAPRRPHRAPTDHGAARRSGGRRRSAGEPKRTTEASQSSSS